MTVLSFYFFTSYFFNYLENNSGPPSETASLDLDFFASNSAAAVSEDLSKCFVNYF